MINILGYYLVLDSAYLEPESDKILVITCWIPLVDTNGENGCLQVKRLALNG